MQWEQIIQIICRWCDFFRCIKYRNRVVLDIFVWRYRIHRTRLSRSIPINKKSGRNRQIANGRNRLAFRITPLPPEELPATLGPRSLFCNGERQGKRSSSSSSSSSSHRERSMVFRRMRLASLIHKDKQCV